MASPKGPGTLVMAMQAGLQERDWAIGGIVEREVHAGRRRYSDQRPGCLDGGVCADTQRWRRWRRHRRHGTPEGNPCYRANSALGPGGIYLHGVVVTFLVAASIVGVKSPFSADLIMVNATVREGLMPVWENAGEAAACRDVCKSYAVALENREKTIKSIGPKAFLGQRLPLAGLGLVAI